MPLCQLRTNIPNTDIKDGIEERIAVRVAEILGKPLERMVVTVVPGVRLFRKGSSDPGCLFTIHSIGVFDKERNSGYTEPILELVTKELNISKDRISLVYRDLEREFVGN